MTTTTAIRSGIWTVHEARAEFRARGLAGHAVIGTIAVVSGSVEVGADHLPVRLTATLDPASIDTGNARRDKDLRGKRFLDVATNPVLRVDAEQISANRSGWECRATIRGAGSDAVLPISAEFDGPAGDSRLLVRGVACLDLRDVGIRVPSLLVRRRVELTVRAELRLLD